MIFSQDRAKSFHTYRWLSDESLSAWIVSHLYHYGDSICEVGAGVGNLLPALAENFKTIHLTEPSPSMFEKLQEKVAQAGRAVFAHRCGAELLPLDDKTVHISLSKSSLHHFADQARGLREMARIASHALAVVEVVAPDDCCLDYLRALVLRKEPGRKPATIFTEQTIKNVVSPFCREYRVLYFDQYIDLEIWLAGSELSGEYQEALLKFAKEQRGEVRSKMQIHYRSNRLVQLRRMLLFVGVL